MIFGARVENILNRLSASRVHRDTLQHGRRFWVSANENGMDIASGDAKCIYALSICCIVNGEIRCIQRLWCLGCPVSMGPKLKHGEL